MDISPLIVIYVATISCQCIYLFTLLLVYFSYAKLFMFM